MGFKREGGIGVPVLGPVYITKMSQKFYNSSRSRSSTEEVLGARTEIPAQAEIALAELKEGHMKRFGRYVFLAILWAGLYVQPARSAETYVFGRMDVGAGPGPIGGIVAADFNGDGKPDFAVANAGNNTVSIFLQTSTGTFAKTDYTVGSQPVAVAVADFNGDGHPDLVVVNNNCPNGVCGQGSVSVLINRGDGTFLNPVSYSTQATDGAAIATGGFNGDGKPDIAVLNGTYGSTGPGSVSVLLNQGNGTFLYKGNYAAGTGVIDIVAFKPGGTGTPSLAVTNNNPPASSVAVLRGNGDGSFQAPVYYPVGTNAFGIAAGDFNGDGNPDLAVAAYTSTGGVVSVFLGRSDGTFASKVDYPVPEGPTNVTIGDLNGDHKLDLIVGAETLYPGGGAVVVLLGDGDGTFQPGVQYLTGNNPISIVTADFNGDGYLDVAFTNGDVSRVSILLGNGNGTFPVAATYRTGRLPIAVAAGDVNGDGWPDLAVANYEDNTVGVYLNNGLGTFTLAHTYSVGQQPRGVALSDLNGDHKLDLVVTNGGDNTISILLGNGDGTFTLAHTYSVGSNPYGLAVGDLNGDGKADVVTANTGDDTISVLLGNGDGTFQTQVTYVTNVGPSSVAIADFNGDGKADLAVADSGTPVRIQDPGLVSVFLNQGNGTFGTKTDYPAGYNPQTVVAVDLNGDGKPDLALATNLDTHGFVAVLLGKGDGTFLGETLYPEGYQIYSLVAGDFNADGHADLAVTSSENDTMFIMAGDGLGGLHTIGTYGTADGSVSIATGRFSPKVGFAGPDIVVGNYYSDTLSVFLNVLYRF